MTGESAYRCAECGHGKHLWAWAGANVYGPLGADGELEREDDVWVWGIHEDSIQCEKHPAACIEHFAGGEWCRWWQCPRCGGKGAVAIGTPKAPNGYPCSRGIERAGKYGPYKIHKGDLPVPEWEARMAAERAEAEPAAVLRDMRGGQ